MSDIPENLHLPILTLTRAAFLYRELFFIAAGRCDAKGFEKLVTDRTETLMAGDAAITTWCNHFGIPEDE